MKGKKIFSEEFKNLKKTRKLLEEFPDLIFAEEDTFDIHDEIKLLRDVVRIGHLPTLKYMMIPTDSLPLTKEFLKNACKAFATKKMESYKLFRIINS